VLIMSLDERLEGVLGTVAARASRFVVLDRERLSAAIGRAAARGVAVLTGPSGVGKSVALSMYLERRSDRGISFIVPHGIDAAGLVRALAALVGGKRSDGLQHAITSARDLASRWLSVRWLADVLSRRAIRWMAIDGAERLAPCARALLGELMDLAAEPVWLVTCRNIQELALRGVLGAGRLGQPIRDDELSFTADEAVSLAHSNGAALRLSDARALVDGCNGWAIAVALAIVNADEALAIPPSGTAGMMLQAFIDGVLTEELSRAEYEALTWLVYIPGERAVLDTLDDPSIDEVMHAVSARLPLLKLRADTWLAHELLLEPLRLREEQRSPRERSRRWRRAGKAHESLGRYGEALTAYVRGGVLDEASRLVRAQADVLRERGYAAEVARAISAITVHGAPEERVGPIAVAAHEADRGAFDRADTILERAATRSDAVGKTAAIRLSALRVNRGQPGSIALLQHHAARRDADAEVLSAYAVALAAEDRFAESDAVARRALAEIARCDDRLTEARCWQRLALAAFFGQDAEKATLHCHSALEVACASDFDDVAARCHSVQYALAVAADDDEAAREEARMMALHARRAGLWQLESSALTALFIDAAERGDDEEFMSARAGLGQGARIRGFADQFPYALACALGETRAGRNASAAAVMRRLAKDHGSPPEVRAVAALVAALYEVERDPRGAASVLRANRTELNATGTARARSAGTAILGFAAMAVLEARVGQRTLAVRAARQARRAARTNRERALASAAHDVANAIRPDRCKETLHALERAGLPGYARLLRIALPVGAAELNTTSVLERELLQLYAERRSAKEIASMTGRNLWTVRTHLRNGMRKIGASGREDLIMLLNRTSKTARPSSRPSLSSCSESRFRRYRVDGRPVAKRQRAGCGGRDEL
jgi:DNA-binding CsgD family transcriptional regulator